MVKKERASARSFFLLALGPARSFGGAVGPAHSLARKSAAGGRLLGRVDRGIDAGVFSSLCKGDRMALEDEARTSTAKRTLPVILMAAVIQGGSLYALHLAIKGHHWPATDAAWLTVLYAVAVFVPHLASSYWRSTPAQRRCGGRLQYLPRPIFTSAGITVPRFPLAAPTHSAALKNTLRSHCYCPFLWSVGASVCAKPAHERPLVDSIRCPVQHLGWRAINWCSRRRHFLYRSFLAAAISVANAVPTCWASTMTRSSGIWAILGNGFSASRLGETRSPASTSISTATSRTNSCC